METAGNLIAAMAAKCRDMLRAAKVSEPQLPDPLHQTHLLWMCDLIEQHAEDWPETKLHRWIGFVQGGMLANGILDLPGAKAMFDDAKLAHGGGGQDQDLIDHLNPRDSFELDIGGQG
jgi:hypothetical protein